MLPEAVDVLGVVRLTSTRAEVSRTTDRALGRIGKRATEPLPLLVQTKYGVAGFLPRSPSSEEIPVFTRRAALTVALAALGSGALPTAAAALPSSPATTPPVTRAVLPRPTGRHSVSTRSLPLTDLGRTDPFGSRPGPRRLMVQLWYPAYPGLPRPTAVTPSPPTPTRAPPRRWRVTGECGRAC